MNDIDLGLCCGCGWRPAATNVVLLPYRAPKPGTGWACLTCGLAPDGAIAVLCDVCAALLEDGGAQGLIRFVCVGFAGEGERTALEALIEPFEHDQAAHEADQA